MQPSLSTARPLHGGRRHDDNFGSPPPSPSYYPEYAPQAPVLPKRSQRYLAFLLKPLVLPAVVVGLPVWPLVALLCAVPIIGVMAIPILLLMSIILLYAVAWISYLALAQKDLPAAWSNPRSWSPKNFAPFLPLNPVRCAKVDLAALRYSLTAIRIVFPAIFDWSYRRIMVIGTTKGSRVVKEGILYGSPSRGKRLDVYLPAEAPVQPPSSSTSNAFGPTPAGSSPPVNGASYGSGAPVIVVIPSVMAPLTITTKRRLYLQLALRLRRLGYCVVVADITYYPESRIRSSIVDLRLVLRWTAKNCQRYGGDPNKIYVMGHGLSAHLVMLTVAQEAVVLSREGHLDRAYERQRHLLRSRHGQHGYDAEADEEWFKSGEVGKPTTERRLSVASALDESNNEPVQVQVERGPGLVATGSDGTDGWVDESVADMSHEARSGVTLKRAGGGVSGSASESRAHTPTRSHHRASTSRKLEEAESILTSAAYRKAEEEVGNGLKRVEIYEPEVELPPLAGVILLSGISDVIKGFRSESERGLEHLSYLRRSTGPSHFSCLIHSPAHLLYAAKNIVDPRLLPDKFLLIHGGKDSVVPVEQSTLLKTLLVGIGVENVRLRAYRNLGHAESVACLFLGMAKRYTRYTRQISEDISTFINQ